MSNVHYAISNNLGSGFLSLRVSS